MDRPTVAGRVRRLRACCRTHLFRHRKDGVSLASTKRLLLGRDRGVLSSCGRLRCRVRLLRGRCVNRLELNTDAAVTRCILPPLLKGFVTGFPRIGLSLVGKGSQKIRATLRRRQVSLNLIRKVFHLPGLGCASFLRSRLMTIIRTRAGLSVRSRVAPRSLPGVPLILHRENSKALSIFRHTLSRRGLGLSSLGMVVCLNDARDVGLFLRRASYVKVMSVHSMRGRLITNGLHMVRVGKVPVRHRFGFIRLRKRRKKLSRIFVQFTKRRDGDLWSTFPLLLRASWLPDVSVHCSTAG